MDKENRSRRSCVEAIPSLLHCPYFLELQASSGSVALKSYDKESYFPEKEKAQEID